MDSADPKLETALRQWTGQLLPVGTEVFIDCGQCEGYMTTVVGHNTMLKPLVQIGDEHVEIKLEFTAEARVEFPTDQKWAASQVAYLLSEGGWKLRE